MYSKWLKNDSGSVITLEEFWMKYGNRTYHMPFCTQDYDKARDTYKDILRFESYDMKILEALIMTATSIHFPSGPLGKVYTYIRGSVSVNTHTSRPLEGLDREDLIMALFNILQERKAEQQKNLCKLEHTTYQGIL